MFEGAFQTLLSITILGFLVFWIYAKFAKKTVKEVFQDLIEKLNPKEVEE